MLFLMFLGNFSTLSISPLTPVLMEQFDTTESKVAALVSEVTQVFLNALKLIELSFLSRQVLVFWR